VFLICIVLVIFFSFYITIIVQLYGTAHWKKITSYIIFFAFSFCVYWLVFLICTVLVFFFFITIVVHLYSTTHRKNN
jgi:hypothetical protein